MSQSRRKWWLRCLLWGPLLIIVIASSAYLYLTDPSRLRAVAIDTLGRIPISEIDVGSVSVNPWGMVELSDLELRVTESESTDIGAPLARIASVRLHCNLLGLLQGKIQTQRIELDHLTLTLIHHPSDHVAENVPEGAEAGLELLRDIMRQSRGRLPRVEVRNADIQVKTAVADRTQLLQRVLVDAIGQEAGGGYYVRCQRPGATHSAVAELQWDQATEQVTVAFDWIPLGTIQAFMPARLQEMLQSTGVDGRLRVDRLVLSAGEPAGGSESAPLELSAANLSFGDVHLSIPIEPIDTPQDRIAARRVLRGCFLQVRDAAIDVHYARATANHDGALEARIDGALNDASLSARLQLRPECLKQWADSETTTAPAPIVQIEDVVDATLQVEGLTLPTNDANPAFVTSPRLLGPIRAAFEDYDPRGRVNLGVAVHPPGTRGVDGDILEGGDRVETRIEAIDTGCTYFRFPYAFERARGTVRVVEGRVLFEDLCAWHDNARVCVEGHLNSTAYWTGFEMRFEGTSIPLDADLYAALPPEYQQLWQETAPLGLCNISTVVRRPEGTPELGAMDPPAVEVDARLTAGSLTVAEGQRMTAADGWLLAADNTVTIADLHGFVGPSAISQSGTVRVSGDRIESNVRITATDWPVRHTVELHTDDSSPPRQISLRARANAWGHVSGRNLAGTERSHLMLKLEHGELTGFVADRPWRDLRGEIVVRPQAATLVDMRCRQNESSLRIRGALPAADATHDAMDLRIEAKTPAVEGLVPQFAPADWAEIVDEMGLQGPGRVVVLLHRSDRAHDDMPTIRVDVEANQMRWQRLPLDLHKLDARVEMEPGRFRLHPSTAAWGSEGKIDAEGSGAWQADQKDVRLSVSARKMSFAEPVVQALPEPVTNLLQRISAEGEFDALLNEIRVSGGEELTWKLEGTIPLRKTNLALGLDLTDVDGELSGSCLVRPDGAVDMSAELRIHRGRIAGRPIERWDGKIAYADQGRWVALSDLHGRLCDGEAQGALRIDPETTEYELSLKLHDVSAAALLPAPKPVAEVEEPPEPPPGRIDGDIYLRGTAKTASSRNGGGELRIRGASFLESPVLADVAEQQEGSISETVDRAELSFLWQGDLIRLTRVDIHSRDLRLVGEGTWDMKTDALQLTLLGAHPEHLDKVLLLSDLLESAGQELVRYQVTGTRADPKVSAEPLYKLNDTFRALLGAD